MTSRFGLLGALASTYIAIAATFIAGPAHAQPSPDATSAQSALELNRRSAELYRQQRYAEAIALLREAYRLKPEPVIQYNLARACEKLADYACAIDAYEIYLATGRPADSASIEARVVYCRNQLAAEHVKPGPPPARRSRHLLPPIVTAIGGLGVGVGVALAASARGRHDDAERDPTQVGAAHEQDVAVSRMTIANTFLIGGGAIAVGGAVWWIVDAMSHRAASTRAQVGVGVGVGSVAISVAF